MGPRFGNGGARGTRQFDDTPLSDAPLEFGKSVSASSIARLRGTGRNPFPTFQQGPGAEKLGNTFRRQGKTALANRAGRLQVATGDRAAHAAGRVKNEFQPKLSSYQTSGVGKSLLATMRAMHKAKPLPRKSIPTHAVQGGWRDAQLDARETGAAHNFGKADGGASRGEPSSGRTAAGYFFGGPHGLVAGRKGHKLRAGLREAGETTLGVAPGAAVSYVAARRASHTGGAVGEALGLAGGIAGGVHAVRANNRMGRYKAERGGKKTWNSKLTEEPVGKGFIAGKGMTPERRARILAQMKVRAKAENKARMDELADEVRAKGVTASGAAAAYKPKNISKSRHYDPEHRRQQKLGAATALLTVGGGVAGTKGVKGALKTTRELRALKTVPTGFVKPGDKASTVGQHKLAQRVGMIGAKDAAWGAGGLAGVGGAAAVQSHANSRRGKAWD